MPDPFIYKDDEVSSPARFAFAVTKSDSTNFLSGAGLRVPKALYIGTGGDLVVQLVGDAGTVTFKNVGDCTLLPIRAQRVLSTGTTAADIVGLT